MNLPRYAWQNGRVVPWAECVLHARSPGAFWGANVFEGVRAYTDDDGRLHAFRLADHLARLRRSLRSLHLATAYTDADLVGACRDVVTANGFDSDVHLCLVAYVDLGPDLDPMAHTTSTGMHLTATAAPRPATHRTGVAAGVSSWRRISDDSMPPRIKAGANYHNSRLAQHEAVRNGFDTALLLNHRGTVSEAPGSCVVIVRDGELVTPPGTSGVLEGITVATTAELAGGHLGLPMRRREIDRSELYVADEVFLCGTMSELLPVTSVDRVPVGDGRPGPVTLALQGHYDDAVRNRSGRQRWCTPVRTRVPA